MIGSPRVLIERKVNGCTLYWNNADMTWTTDQKAATNWLDEEVARRNAQMMFGASPWFVRTYARRTSNEAMQGPPDGYARA